jgi:uncharacterized HAD superfamily protein/hypoxanthine phosphoribosyltransferase
MEENQMNFVSYKRLYEDIYRWVRVLPKDFDLIIGIPRSGLLPALLLSLHYNIPVSEIESFKNGHIFKSGQRGQFVSNIKKNIIHKVIVVDDSCTSGKSIANAKYILKNVKGYDIKYGAMYVTEDSKKYVDYFCSIINSPRCFQWNWMHHTFLMNSCSDMDGVLCGSPSHKQNDDGKNYIQFLKNAKPMFIPSVKIKYIVTARLEKYRRLTEEWLSRYNIKYEKLFMMNYPNMQKRKKDGKYSEYKAGIYMKSNAILFIEDDIVQAQKIAQITRKPVLCITNWIMYK